MNRQTWIVGGVVLILMGAIALSCGIVGVPLASGMWRLWPLAVVGLGALLVLPPLLLRTNRALGVLFIPGVPVLTTGGILLLASVFNLWGIWRWLWPQEVLAVGAGFLFAAAYTRSGWLLIPAIVVGANGVLLQFCALTGLWGVWTVMWMIEPLSAGLALLAVQLKHRSPALLTVGVLLCVLAGVGFVESLAILSVSAIVSVGWLWRWVGPVTLMGTGLILLVWGLVRGKPTASAAAG